MEKSAAINRADQKLISAIAQMQDPQAFTTLYKRYAARTLALAQYLTGNRAMAEEAVQETMLQVWKRASTFRPGGNARAWITCIVTSQA